MPNVLKVADILAELAKKTKGKVPKQDLSQAAEKTWPGFWGRGARWEKAAGGIDDFPYGAQTRMPGDIPFGARTDLMPKTDLSPGYLPGREALHGMRTKSWEKAARGFDPKDYQLSRWDRLKRKRPSKKALGIGAGTALVGGVAAANIWGEDEPKPLPTIPPFTPSAGGLGGLAGLSAAGAGTGADQYAEAQQGITDFYNELLEQSAQDTARREQMMQDVYQEQQQYQQQLMGQMDTQNQLRQAQMAELNSDMQQAYADMGASQGFSAAGTAGDRGRIFDEAQADAMADARQMSTVGGTLDDLLTMSAAASGTQQAEDIAAIQAQGAEDQRSLRNEMLRATTESALDRAQRQEQARLEAELQIQTEAAKGSVIPAADRPAAVADALQMLGGGGSTLNDLPPQLQDALNYFWQTGDSNALNYMISTFQMLTPEQLQQFQG